MKGPKIHLHIEMREGSIINSHLTLSDHFSCSGANLLLQEWLEQYIEGKSIPLNLFSGSEFQKKAMLAMQQIPFGSTMSYKELAAFVGNPKAARAIGNACNRNPFPLLVPCHRIVQSNGKIGGFASDLEIKRRLLEFEKKGRKKTCPMIIFRL